MATAASKLIRKPGNKVLKMLSHGAPMAEVLNELCNFIGGREHRPQDGRVGQSDGHVVAVVHELLALISREWPSDL